MAWIICAYLFTQSTAGWAKGRGWVAALASVIVDSVVIAAIVLVFRLAR